MLDGWPPGRWPPERERSMKKQESKKLKLSKDTLRHLENASLEEAIGAEPTTTVLTRWRTCTCQV
jgi:hypothetical protein